MTPVPDWLVERVAGGATRGRVGALGDLDEQVVAVFGPALPRAQPVQADVRRDPEQQRRRRLVVELVGAAEDLDEDVVHAAMATPCRSRAPKASRARS